MILTLWTGSETARDAKAAIRAFWVPVNGREGKEGALTLAHRDKAVTGVRRVSAEGPFSAHNEHFHEAGDWRKDTLDIEDGVLFKLHINNRQAWNTMEIHAGMYCVAREEAALRLIEVPLSRSPGMRFQKHVISGRFDIVTLDDAELLGAPVKRQFSATFDPVRIKRACTIVVEEPEVSSRIKLRVREVVTSTGTQRIVMPERRRALGIRA